MQTIAFIGLGNMGSGMAANLVKAGHRVLAVDLSEAAVQKAVQAGAEDGQDLKHAAQNADVIITMLPSGQHVMKVYREIFSALTARPLLIDCSTINVESARQIAEEAKNHGFDMVDAPVSGGTIGADAATLTFMAGGSESAFEKAQPILQTMGKAVIHAGSAGAGQAAKICNNMLLAITMIGTCEAFNMAEKLGLDPKTFYDISSKSSGQSWSMTSYCPIAGPVPASPANHDFKAGFATALMLKDLKLAQSAAANADASTPMGALAVALFQAFSSHGHSEQDFSAIVNFLK